MNFRGRLARLEVRQRFLSPAALAALSDADLAAYIERLDAMLPPGEREPQRAWLAGLSDEDLAMVVAGHQSPPRLAGNRTGHAP